MEEILLRLVLPQEQAQEEEALFQIFTSLQQQQVELLRLVAAPFLRQREEELLLRLVAAPLLRQVIDETTRLLPEREMIVVKKRSNLERHTPSAKEGVCFLQKKIF